MPEMFTISQPPKSTYKADAQLADSSNTKINPATSNNQETLIVNQTNGTQKTKLTDGYGWSVEATLMDEIRAVSPTRLVGAQFGPATGTTPSTGVTGTDPNFWTGTCANSATIVQTNAQILLSSGTNSAGSAKLNSTRKARYVSGVSIGFRGIIQLGDIGVANNTRRWGIATGATMPTITDGALFELAGTTLSAITIKGSSRNLVAVLSAPTTNVATYEIYWTNSKVCFVINGSLVATHLATTDTWAATMEHYIYLDNINSGSTTNSTISCRVASIRRFGHLKTNTIYKNITSAATNILKYGAGMMHGITINSPGGVNDTIILYDNVTAAVPTMGTIAIGKNTQPTTLTYNDGIPFNTGLTIVSNGTTDFTVIYE